MLKAIVSTLAGMTTWARQHAVSTPSAPVSTASAHVSTASAPTSTRQHTTAHQYATSTRQHHVSTSVRRQHAASTSVRRQHAVSTPSTRRQHAISTPPASGRPMVGMWPAGGRHLVGIWSALPYPMAPHGHGAGALVTLRCRLTCCSRVQFANADSPMACVPCVGRYVRGQGQGRDHVGTVSVAP